MYRVRIRASTSAPPPAGNGTTSLMILLGYGCAATRAGAHISVARTTKSATAFMGHQHVSRGASAAAVTLSRSKLVRNPASVLKQLEVFALLPLRDLGVVARELGLLDAQVIVDERLAEAFGEAGVVAQRGQRLLESRRQQLGARLVGGVRRRAGIEGAPHAVEAGDDLRGHVEIGIGGGLAHAVLEPRRGVASRAEHADHHPAIVVAPDGAVRRQRVAAIALVAVDRGRGEGGGRARMREQAGEEGAPRLR